MGALCIVGASIGMALLLLRFVCVGFRFGSVTNSRGVFDQPLVWVFVRRVCVCVCVCGAGWGGGAGGALLVCGVWVEFLFFRIILLVLTKFSFL